MEHAFAFALCPNSIIYHCHYQGRFRQTRTLLSLSASGPGALSSYLLPSNVRIYTHKTYKHVLLQLLLPVWDISDLLKNTHMHSTIKNIVTGKIEAREKGETGRQTGRTENPG